MYREKILRAAKAELERHVWGTFVDRNMSVALGGTGVVVLGCEAGRKRFGTNCQYLRHLADDVLPGILESALSKASPPSQDFGRKLDPNFFWRSGFDC
jgi:hypothetical protein